MNGNDDIDYRIAEALGRFHARHHTASPFRAALIDMDGTLYDSMVNHTAAWHRMVSGLGIESDRNEYYLFEGMTGAATINLLFRRAFRRDATSEEIENLYRLKTVYFNELPAVGVMPGARRMLEILKRKGIRPILVTGSGQSSLIGRLATDFPGTFADGDMITSRDVVHGKPDPEPYLKAMRIAGVTPAESIVVENAPLGVTAGARSGAFTVGLTTGPIPMQSLADAGADIVFGSMAEFADSLHKLI